ncbi:hypothetical protein ES703_81781 [subsurface metagenome]
MFHLIGDLDRISAGLFLDDADDRRGPANPHLNTLFFIAVINMGNIFQIDGNPVPVGNDKPPYFRQVLEFAHGAQGIDQRAFPNITAGQVDILCPQDIDHLIYGYPVGG